MSRMAQLLELSKIPREWFEWSDVDDWGMQADEFDRAQISDRIRKNWKEFERTQTYVLEISAKLLLQIDALADPIPPIPAESADLKLAQEQRTNLIRLRARESEGVMAVGQALERVVKVRLQVLEGITRPTATEDDNKTHLKSVAPNYMNTKAAAAHFKVSTGCIKKWLDAGLISAIMTPGGARRYDINSAVAVENQRRRANLTQFKPGDPNNPAKKKTAKKNSAAKEANLETRES